MSPSNVVPNRKKTPTSQANERRKAVRLRKCTAIQKKSGLTTRENCISLDINSRYLILNVINSPDARLLRFEIR
jgi:hypothetical protein